MHIYTPLAVSVYYYINNSGDGDVVNLLWGLSSEAVPQPGGPICVTVSGLLTYLLTYSTGWCFYCSLLFLYLTSSTLDNNPQLPRQYYTLSWVPLLLIRTHTCE